MVYIVNNVWCPHSKPEEVAKKYLKVVKEIPHDPAVSKILAIMVRPTNKNVHVMGIHKIKKGNMEKHIERAMKIGNMLASDIEGLKYNTAAYLDFTEAYAILEIEPPEI